MLKMSQKEDYQKQIVFSFPKKFLKLWSKNMLSILKFEDVL